MRRLSTLDPLHVCIVGFFMSALAAPCIPDRVDLSVAFASAAETIPAIRPGLTIDDSQALEVIARPTLHRQISPIRFVSNLRTYEFLATHPPLAAQLARRLYPLLERYTVTQVEEGVYTVEDHGALRGEARLIAATSDQRIYRVEGEFRSLAHLLRFTGRMVLILRYREVREGNRTAMESDLDFYLRIDHPFFHAMTKLLSPLIHTLIDRRVRTIVEAMRILFDQVHINPDGLYQRMATWPEMQPSDLEAYRNTFVEKESATR